MPLFFTQDATLFAVSFPYFQSTSAQKPSISRVIIAIHY
ncbi:conserved hypothetical protein (plasmid) [Bacillus cereus H3081.97]|uniref:Uncharacterized protein n=2 Tax=Bacillus cereus TaxID=1396 RepID=A1BYJ0_BACCE|nr:hypothetical protein BcAH187_pCER270_0048 [Bacillus cereus]ACI30335.1 conserved hypothetical protein [Bacillus cereus H3081.97]ACJ82711.1 conserved hypothetical protein [Bacillus cereus AH187]EEL79077.1 hypothetical protein bcere0028_53030 [Bacillus cereus AH1271]